MTEIKIVDAGLYTPAEVATLLDVSERQVRGWRSAGLLTFTYLGGSRKASRVLGSDLKRFIASHRGENALAKAQRSRAARSAKSGEAPDGPAPQPELQ